MNVREPRAFLVGETHNGQSVSFSNEAYSHAMERYRLKDIEYVVKKLESGEHFEPMVARFFRDFAILQEIDHPDYDRGRGIGSLATRIEIALGEVTPQELDEIGYDLQAAIFDYELAFGE